MKNKNELCSYIIWVFIIIFFLLNSFAGKAHNWIPYNHLNICNYATSNSFADIYTIKTDSFKVINSDTLFYLNKIVDNIYYNTPIKYKPQFLLSNVQVKNNCMIFKDTIEYIFKIDAQIGDSWIFDSIRNIKAKVVSMELDTFFGQNDSSKYIVLSTEDTIVLSKNYGIISFNIPYLKLKYKLIGIENLDLGFKIPDFFDFFNFNVGDLFEYKKYIEYLRPNGHTTSEYNGIYKYEILSKEKNENEIKYIVNYSLKDSDIYNSYYCGEWCENSYNSFKKITTIYFRKNDFLFLNNYNNQGFQKEGTYIDSFFMQKISFSVNDSLNIKLKKYKLFDFERSVSTSYGVGFGLIHQDSSYRRSGDIIIKIDLTGCQKNDKVYGIIHDDSYFTGNKENKEKASVEIYPNPISDYLEVCSNNHFENATVRITNINGCIVFSKQIKGNSNRIDLTILKPGVYNAIIVSASKVWSKVIVKL
jgi:hypothetical protein